MSGWTAHRQAATSAGNLTMAVPLGLPRGAASVSRAGLYLALGLLSVSVVARAIAVERPPVGNLWEYTTALAFGIVLFTAVFELAFKERAIAAVMLPVAVVLMAISLLYFPSDIRPLVPALQANRILGLHVTMMVMAYSALSISFGAAVLYLLQSSARPASLHPGSFRAGLPLAASDSINGMPVDEPSSPEEPGEGERGMRVRGPETLTESVSAPSAVRPQPAERGVLLATSAEAVLMPPGSFGSLTPPTAAEGVAAAPGRPPAPLAARPRTAPARRFASLPDAETLGEIAYWSVLVGFPMLTLGVALGAYWANNAWGRYWGWDPKETSALLTWFLYAGYLHARGLRGWEGKRSAWLLVGAFGAVMFTYFAVNFVFSGLHSYAGV